jgi:RHS repeat-associated protein
VVTNASGAILDDSDFYAYGGERAVSASSGNDYKFEGKERDTESGLDDFGARYYSSQLGRFISADWSAIPVPVPYADLTNPQTLNLYAIVRDNPETFADLDGHDAMDQTPQTGDKGDLELAEREKEQKDRDKAQNTNMNKGQMAKGGAEVTAGVAVIIGIAQPEVGVAEAVVGALLSSGLLVKGSTDVAVGATGGGDTSQMKDAMDVAQSPTKMAIAVANGGNMKQANNVGNVLEGAAAAKNLASNPHQSITSIGMMG